MTHIFAYSDHAFLLDWDEKLDALDDVLFVAPSLYRFVDLSIELCTGLKETLKGKLPIVPEYLAASENFLAMVECRDVVEGKFGSTREDIKEQSDRLKALGKTLKEVDHRRSSGIRFIEIVQLVQKEEGFGFLFFR